MSGFVPNVLAKDAAQGRWPLVERCFWFIYRKNKIQFRQSGVKDCRPLLPTNLDGEFARFDVPDGVPSPQGLKRSLRFYGRGTEAEVENVQQTLRALNCFHGEITGVYDESTEQAVVKFNTARDSAFPSKAVDSTTWDALFGTNEFGENVYFGLPPHYRE